MPEESFTPCPHTDRDGVVGWTEETGETGPCVLCGMRCRVMVSGTRVHLLCWERSSASERASRQPQASTVAAQPSPHPPAVSADPVPAAVSTAPMPAPALSEAAPSGRASAAAAASNRPAATTAGGQFRAAAVLVDVDGIWCSNGERVDLPGELRHLGDLVQLAERLKLSTQVTKYRAVGGQVWVGERLLRSWGMDVDAITAVDFTKRDETARGVTHGLPAVTEALSAGYSIGGRDGDSLGRWTRMWKGSAKSIWVVLLPALNWDGVEMPLLQGAPDHASLARRIGLLATALGHPYQLSGATTGLDLMMTLRWKDQQTLFEPRTPIEPATLNVELDISWCRPPTTAEREHQFVHAYDRSGSYLAGVSGLELGVGDPVHHPDGLAFKPKLPGYWLVEIPGPGDWRMPNPLDPRGANAGRTRWVTTPGLEFALEQGYEPAVREAYVWPEHSRVLDPWYERIRDARTRLDTEDPDAQAARDQLKAIYAPTIGMLGSQIFMAGRRGYAPDRRHQIIAKARTNILRRVSQIGRDSGRWPVAIIADTIVYTSPEQDPVKAWPGTPDQLGRALGRYKVEGTGPLSDQLPYLTGGLYRGKPGLVDDVDDGSE